MITQQFRVRIETSSQTKRLQPNKNPDQYKNKNIAAVKIIGKPTLGKGTLWKLNGYKDVRVRTTDTSKKNNNHKCRQ